MSIVLLMVGLASHDWLAARYFGPTGQPYASPGQSSRVIGRWKTKMLWSDNQSPTKITLQPANVALGSVPMRWEAVE